MTVHKHAYICGKAPSEQSEDTTTYILLNCFYLIISLFVYMSLFHFLLIFRCPTKQIKIKYHFIQCMLFQKFKENFFYFLFLFNFIFSPLSMLFCIEKTLHVIFSVLKHVVTDRARYYLSFEYNIGHIFKYSIFPNYDVKMTS